MEDERNIRELIVYTLESSGFTARGLESGKELNAAIAEQLPDLILLDIMLPGEDGLEILSRLKASEVTKEIPVIMVTAKGAEYDKVMGLDCGADDYITKPFGMMEFIARVRAVLAFANGIAKSLANGNSVYLEDLGFFRVGIKSRENACSWWNISARS